MTKAIYAEDVNYWKTGERRSPDKWIELAAIQIENLGGKVGGNAFGTNDDGRSAYMIAFQFDGEAFKIVWPVLPTRRPNDIYAARVQAATMLYHHVKGMCIASVILGKRAAFFTHLMLPDGRTASQVANSELIEAMPDLFQPRLIAPRN